MALKDELLGSSARRSAQYRRGAILGLTVAESFILISFVLLLLLALWRSEEAERAEAHLELFGGLSPNEQRLIRQAAEQGRLEEILAYRSEEGTFAQMSEDVQEGQETLALPVPSRGREASLTLSNLEPPWTEARRIDGKPRIIDGDTLEVGGVRVRLQGLHAPEAADPGGSHAGDFLRELTADRRIVCLLDGTKTYERYVGRCFLDGEDIAEASVRAGFSRDCPRFSKGLYAPFETPAAITSLPLPSFCQ